MPFYFRKSVTAGPFRFNFSKSGIGASVGVKGFRVGAGPRGHYIRAGVGGFEYRATEERAGRPRARDVEQIPTLQAQQPVEMREIESGDVLLMKDESFGQLLDEINANKRKFRLGTIFGVTAAVIAAFVAFNSFAMGMVLAGLAILAWYLGDWIDSYRRTSVLFYELGEAQDSYQRVAESFDALITCKAIWHVEAGGAVKDLTTWKRNAGATHIVKKQLTSLAYALPDVLQSNITPPVMRVGRQRLYFLPDVVLIEDRRRFGAISYEDLRLRWQTSSFIEEGKIPSDATVVGHTWKHPNKSGGPDRRYKDNYQIPICAYEVLSLQSSSGLNELLEFSREGAVEPFECAVHSLGSAISGSYVNHFTLTKRSNLRPIRSNT